MESITCLVCGMKINKSNYYINADTLLKKNEENNIVSCPFCGAGGDYLGDAAEVFRVEPNSLDAETLNILDHAMKLEVFNYEFYKEAGKMARMEINKRLFEQLSSIELMHANIHRKLGGFNKLPNLFKPDYSKHETDGLLLQEAEKREKHAILFYRKKSSMVCNQIIQTVITALSEVEKQHEVITKTNKIALL